LAQVQQAGARLIALGDPDYPRALSHIPDPPPLLWVRGAFEERDALALAIVGSRRCTTYGREQADRFAAGLAVAGVTIVSGGAYGIDAAAHEAALRMHGAGGRTIAVIGSGLARPYPKEHAPLFDKIVAEQAGAVVSELPMTFPPSAKNFPRRNRIISGLALGTLLIEAADKSGALITARLCNDEHGRELMAWPGRVDSDASEGCHKAIREGWATLVTSVGEVLSQLGEAGQMLRVATGEVAPSKKGGEAQTATLFDTFNAEQKKIMAVLDRSRALDEVVAATGLPVQRVQVELTMLEIRGAVKRSGGKFERKEKA
jgi:DNA processing protein